MKNEDVRREIKSAGLLLCQVSRQMGIFEHTLYRMMCKELSEENRKRIMDAVEALKGGKT